MAAKIAMIAMTTSSSIRVKAFFRPGCRKFFSFGTVCFPTLPGLDYL
jgi:hypothetical protein